MWWLERQTNVIRRASTPGAFYDVDVEESPLRSQSHTPELHEPKSSEPKFHPPVRRPKPKREKLVDSLTDAQREANKEISQDDCGHEVEIAQLRRDVASLESIVRAQHQAATRQTEFAESERRRFHQFIVGYEHHAAACEAEIEATAADRDASRRESESAMASMSDTHAAEIVRFRRIAEAAELQVALRSETLRRCQQQWTQLRGNHRAALRNQRNESDFAIKALKSEIKTLRTSKAAGADLVRELQAEKARSQIEIDILSARLATAEDERLLLQNETIATSEMNAGLERSVGEVWERAAFALNRDLIAARDASKQLQSSLAQCEDELHAVGEEAANRQRQLEATIGQCREAIANSSRDHQAAIVMVEHRADENQSLHRRLEATEQRMAEAWTIAELATDKLHRHEATLEKLRDQEQRLVDVHQSQLASLHAEVNAREVDVEDLQSTIDDLNASLQTESAERELIRTESARLKAQLSAGRACGSLLIQQYQAKLQAAEETIAFYRNQLQRMGIAPQRRAA